MSRHEVEVEYLGDDGEWRHATADVEARGGTPATRWDPAEGPELRVVSVHVEGPGGSLTLAGSHAATWAATHESAVRRAVEEG